MNSEMEKLQQAKMFIEYLANGVDPIDNMDIDEDTFHNEQIIDCLKYISDVLENNIQRKKRGRKAVYITDKQRSQLQAHDNCKVSEIANEINRVIAENDTCKFQASWINDWLEENGYLCRNAEGNRVSTKIGEQWGITSKFIDPDGDNRRSYYINYYSSDVQTYIFEHLDEILDLRYSGKTSINVNFHNLEFPTDLSINEFIKQNPDKCFIISVGSCDTLLSNGSYLAALIYNGRRKLLSKNGIPTNSSSECILHGIMEAASAIKMSTNIIILTAVSLGFNSPKSKDYQLCSDIISTLDEKGCDISVSVCSGKGEELLSLCK